MYLTGSSAKEFEPLEPDLSNVVSFVQRCGWDDGAPEDWNTGVLPDGTMILAGSARTGFRVNVNTSGAKARAETMSLRVRNGGHSEHLGSLGTLTMEFPSAGAPEFGDLVCIKRLIQVTIDCWSPESVEVVDAGFRSTLTNETKSRTEVIGWVNYFHRRDAEPALPADIPYEAFGPQGMLTVLQPQPPDEKDAAALELALRMYRALSPGQHLTYRSKRSPARATAAG